MDARDRLFLLRPGFEDNGRVAQARGHHFVPRTMHILRYLAATRGVPGPH